MASLILDLTPELQRRLQEEAQKHGRDISDYARMVLEKSLAAPSSTAGASDWNGLPRRAPEDLDALALSQGAPLAARFEDLIGDFWPEDETADEFIATIRQWRREGTRRKLSP